MSEWKEFRLGDLIKTNENSIGRNYSYKRIKYLDTGSITNGKISGFQEFNIEEAPSRAKRLVNINDIIYSTVRPIQRHFGFVDKSIDNLVVSTGFVVISTKKDLESKFLYYLLSNNEIFYFF